jgi:hypothetical protein
MVFTEMKSVFKSAEWFSENVGENKVYKTMEDCRKNFIFVKDDTLKTKFESEKCLQNLLKLVLRQNLTDKDHDDSLTGDSNEKLLKQKFVGYINYYTSTSQKDAKAEETYQNDDDNSVKCFLKGYKYNDGVLTKKDRIQTSQLYLEYESFVKTENKKRLQENKRLFTKLNIAELKQKLTKDYLLETTKISVMYFINIKKNEQTIQNDDELDN